MKPAPHTADLPDFHVRGERHPNARLTEAQVRDMRKAYADAVGARDPSVTMRSLADEFGVSEEQVHRIITRRQWKHLA